MSVSHDAALHDLFTNRLPALLGAHTLPDAIAHGEIVFVVKDGLQPSGPANAFALFAPLEGGPGGRFVPQSGEVTPLCAIELKAVDCASLGTDVASMHKAFMAGRIKLVGDVQRAMILGALFA